jgi:hypothetical protein
MNICYVKDTFLPLRQENDLSELGTVHFNLLPNSYITYVYYKDESLYGV